MQYITRGIAVSVLVLSLSLTGCWASETGWASEQQQHQEEENTQEGVFYLGEIEVFGKAQESRNKTIETVDDEQMRLFDKNDLASAINLLPGVSLTHGGARNELMLSVRGFDIKHVPIFLDGIPIYVPYDGYPDLGRFTTFDLSEIVVSKGFASVLYGPDTMGGAINMISKKPAQSFEMNAGTGYASGNTYNAYGNFGTNQGEWYLQGGASYADSDYFRLSEDFTPTATENGGKRENSYRTDRKINVKLGFTPGEEDEYAFNYINQHGKKGTPPYAGTDPSTTARYWQWPKWDKESFYFNSNTGLGSASYIKSRLYYDLFTNSLYAYDDSTYSTMTRKSSFKSLYADHTAGASIEAGTSLLTRNTLRAAFHYKLDVHKEHNVGYPVQKFEDEIVSIGLEDTVDITEKLYTIIGTDYDQANTLKAQDLDSKTKTVFDFQKGDTSAFNPQIGLFYKLREDGLAHACIAEKSRIPSIKDKYSYKLGTALPNPELDPEKSINYEIGYQQLVFKKLHMETTLFYSDISDFILSRTVPDPSDPQKSLNQNQNIGDMDQYGVELGVSGQLTSRLKEGLNYTWFHSRNKTNNDELLNTPAHKVLAYLQYFPIERLGILGNIDYESSRCSASDGTRIASAFFVANSKLSYEVYKGLFAEVGVNNIFDRDYALDEGFPEAGRSYFANAQYRF